MNPQSQLDELLNRIAEGTANDADSERLSELLLRHPELRQHYFQWMSLHATLCWEYRDRNPTSEGASSLVDARHVLSTRPAHRRSRLISWTVSSAAILLIAFFIIRTQNEAMASAGRIVRGSIEAHRHFLEREYIVEVDWENAENDAAFADKEIRVSTWSDRFWLSIKGRRSIAIGIESDGSVWIALSRLRGIYVDVDEVGPRLRDVADLYSMRMESMLEGLLQEHELEIREKNDFTYVIVATPTGRSGWVREVEVEVDRETKAVRKMVARRRSRRRGASTATFTLVETRVPDESKYELAGHLSPRSTLLTHDSGPNRRQDILEHALGPLTRGWIVDRASSEVQP